MNSTTVKNEFKSNPALAGIASHHRGVFYNLVKRLTLCALVCSMFLINTNDVFSATDDKGNFDECVDLGNGFYHYYIRDMSGAVLYKELQYPDGSSDSLEGKRPPGWIIDPNGKPIDIWAAVDSMRLANPLMSTSEALAYFIPVEDLGDTIMTYPYCSGGGGMDYNSKRHWLDFSNTLSYDPSQLDCAGLIEIARANTTILDTTNNMCLFSMEVPKGTGRKYLGFQTAGPHATGAARIIRDDFSDPLYDIFIISLPASSLGLRQDGIEIMYTDGVDTCKIPRNFFCNCYCWNCPTANFTVDLNNGIGHYELSVPLNSTNATIELLDFSGRTLLPVHTISPNDPLNGQFDLSMLTYFPTGIYILAAKQDNDGVVLGTTVFIKR